MSDVQAVHNTMTSSREEKAWSTSGYLMLGLFVLLLLIFAWRVIAMASGNPTDDEVLRFVIGTALLPIALVLIAKGFYMIQPNQAVAITLFGSYRGTDRHAGLR